jgi:hypothetical protein
LLHAILTRAKSDNSTLLKMSTESASAEANVHAEILERVGHRMPMKLVNALINLEMKQKQWFLDDVFDELENDSEATEEYHHILDEVIELHRGPDPEVTPEAVPHLVPQLTPKAAENDKTTKKSGEILGNDKGLGVVQAVGWDGIDPKLSKAQKTIERKKHRRAKDPHSTHKSPLLEATSVTTASVAPSDTATVTSGDDVSSMVPSLPSRRSSIRPAPMSRSAPKRPRRDDGNHVTLESKKHCEWCCKWIFERDWKTRCRNSRSKSGGHKIEITTPGQARYIEHQIRMMTK